MADDRVRTSIQADGVATVIGSSMAELLAMCDDLALNPHAVHVYGQVKLRPPWANEYENFEPSGGSEPISAEEALDGINRIRNSIVGAQAINWSEHIYPLVSLLNRVGQVGLAYPEAKANVGTLIDFRDEALVLLRSARGEGPTDELHDRIAAFLDRVDR